MSTDPALGAQRAPYNGLRKGRLASMAIDQAEVTNTDAQAIRFLTTRARSEPVSVKL